ncbi:RDD family protein [Agarivorans gilvus]|uniref:RDD family protein n=1 Tax=Agarivorans gilvus TaxID=680279 RepID=UPI0009F9479B
MLALIYFGIMNSTLCNGQTIGKKILRLRVVDGDNNSISLSKSFVRYLILGSPVFLNGVRFSNDTSLAFWLYPLSLIVFGGLLSIIYLYIFNRASR